MGREDTTAGLTKHDFVKSTLASLPSVSLGRFYSSFNTSGSSSGLVFVSHSLSLFTLNLVSFSPWPREPSRGPRQPLAEGAQSWPPPASGRGSPVVAPASLWPREPSRGPRKPLAEGAQSLLFYFPYLNNRRNDMFCRSKLLCGLFNVCFLRL